MRRFFILLSFTLGALYFISCNKGGSSCSNVSLAQDSAVISSFMTSKGLSGYSRDLSTGVVYKILNPGTAPAVTNTSKVIIRYKGTLLDAVETVFDSGCETTACPGGSEGFSVSGFIPGFRVLLTQLARGGRIDGFIPSNYAYECQGIKDNSGNFIIPANACLRFTVEVVDVQ